jgi:hypothetical protein
MVRSVYARTVQQIIDDSFRLCLDFRGSGTDGRLWKYSEVLDDLNFALIDLAKNSGILRGTAVVPITAGVNVYNLPADCIRPLRFMIHGLQGKFLLPTSKTKRDLQRLPFTPTGDPRYFFREFLAPNQVGFFPTPSQTGSTFTEGAGFGGGTFGGGGYNIGDGGGNSITPGILRGISDADGHIPFDANKPLRAIRGVPFTRLGGDGKIIRNIISPQGNIQVWYLRTPEVVERQNQYPDVGIPEFIHMWIKYGVAARMCMYSKRQVHQDKLKRFLMTWRGAVNRLKRFATWQGPMGNEVRPF